LRKKRLRAVSKTSLTNSAQSRGRAVTVALKRGVFEMHSLEGV
jgi:hypothetical protein